MSAALRAACLHLREMAVALGFRMILAVDAVGNRHGGGATVLCDVLHATQLMPQIQKIIVFASPGRQFALPEVSGMEVVDVIGAESGVGRLRWAFHGLDCCLARTGVDGVLGLNGGGSMRQVCASVVLIQQSLPYSSEALARCPVRMRLRMAVVRWVTGKSAKAAHHILVQSRAMRTAVSQAFELSPERISVFPPTATALPRGADSARLERLRLAKGRHVLLYVGNDFPHKNLEVVEQGLLRVPKAQRPDWYVTLPESSWICRRGIAIPLGNLSAVELAEAYTRVTALVMSSIIETVGLPILEAMRAGVPVLAADRPYAHEAAEDAAIFFDPLSADDFAAKLVAVMSDTRRRERLMTRGREVIARRDARSPYQGMLEKVTEVAGMWRRESGAAV